MALPRGRPFPKGHPKPPTSGRKAGTPNRVTPSIKALMHELVAEEPAAIKAAIRTKLLAGDTAMTTLFAYYLDGKPAETVLTPMVQSIVIHEQSDSHEAPVTRTPTLHPSRFYKE
jgi:hypothetical protein